MEKSSQAFKGVPPGVGTLLFTGWDIQKMKSFQDDSLFCLGGMSRFRYGKALIVVCVARNFKSRKRHGVHRKRSASREKLPN